MRYQEPYMSASVAGSWLAEADVIYQKTIGDLTLARLI